MQFRNIFVLTLFILLGSTSCNQVDARKAVAVNDEIIAGHRQVVRALEGFIDVLDQKQSAELSSALEELNKATSEGLSDLQKMEPPKCDNGFLDATQKMYQFYLDASEGDYQSIARFYTQDSITYEQYDSLQLLIESVEGQQAVVEKNFVAAQASFAQSCGFKLVRNVE